MTRVVTTQFEEGSTDASMCFLAEAPSYVEVRENAPLRGPAGQLFERLLHSAQIARASIYTLNVFETPVKKLGDKPDIFSLDGALLWKPGKGFTEAGLAASANTLRRLRASRANVICAMGGPAYHLALLTELPPNPAEIIDELPQASTPRFKQDPRSISKWRGSVVAGIDGRKIIGTFHPASCLRGAYENRYYIIYDLRRVKEESASPVITLPQRNFIIDPTFEQACAFLRHCAAYALTNSKPVCTDIEILNGQVSCFSLAVTPNEAISIPLIDQAFESRWTPEEETEIWRLYAAIISDARIAKVNQNITFDLSVLLQLNGIVPRGVVHDTMVAHSIIYPFLDKRLGVVCSLYTREPYYKDDGDLLDAHGVENFERYWLYSAKDAAIALEAWEHLQPELIANGYWPTYELTMNMVSALVFMMVRGMALDETALLETKQRATIELAAKVEQLAAAFERPVITEVPKRAADKRAAIAAKAINVNSPKQLCEYFYGEKGVKPYTNQLGKQTIDDKALARIFRRDKLPEAKLLQEYRSQAKMLGTYLEVVYDADKRIRSSYNIRGTWAGRLSSGQTVFGGGMNMQNLAPQFRNFLVSDMR